MDQASAQVYIDQITNILLLALLVGLSAVLTAVFGYVLVFVMRLRKRMHVSLEMSTLEVQLTKDNEIKVDAAEQMFASFAGLKKTGFFTFLEIEDVLAFEIVGKKGEIRFYVSAPNRLIDLVEKTIYSFYPQASIRKVDEPNIFTQEGKVSYGCLAQKNKKFFPLKTYRELPTASLSGWLMAVTGTPMASTSLAGKAASSVNSGA